MQCDECIYRFLGARKRWQETLVCCKFLVIQNFVISSKSRRPQSHGILQSTSFSMVVLPYGMVKEYYNKPVFESPYYNEWWALPYDWIEDIFYIWPLVLIFLSCSWYCCYVSQNAWLVLVHSSLITKVEIVFPYLYF